MRVEDFIKALGPETRECVQNLTFEQNNWIVNDFILRSSTYLRSGCDMIKTLEVFEKTNAIPALAKLAVKAKPVKEEYDNNGFVYHDDKLGFTAMVERDPSISNNQVKRLMPWYSRLTARKEAI